MKAIHNSVIDFKGRSIAVNYIQRYKKWKQFTTNTFDLSFQNKLWTIYKDTKNESNSQLRRSDKAVGTRCELYTKIQKMKAIHNRRLWVAIQCLAVNYIQRYKKWKQFTTTRANALFSEMLWTIYKDTKNESNSQRGRRYPKNRICCELYTKIQKMKAIHNMLY